MRHAIILLLCCCIYVAPLYAAEDTDTQKVSATDTVELKKAAAWYKKLLTNVKKATAAIKKVKEPKHAKRAVKELQRIDKTMPGYIRPKKKVKSNEFDSNDTHIQRLEQLRKSLTEAQKEIVREKKDELKRFLALLDEELERIDEMITSPEWGDAFADPSSEDYAVELFNTSSSISSTVSAIFRYSDCDIDAEEDSFSDSEDEDDEVVEVVPARVKTADDDSDKVKTIPAAPKNKRGNRFRSLD